MSLQARLTALAQAMATDVKALTANQGSLAALSTTAKGSLVAAINELQAALAGAGGNVILDTAGAGDTAHAWSADKAVAALAALKAEIVAGAPAAWDTLIEIGTELNSNQTALGNLLTAVGNRISYDAVQTLTAPQQLQACQNIGVGDPETDLVAAYNAAKA